MHPGAFGTAFHALVEATSPDRLSLPAYQPCLGAVQIFVARQAKKVQPPGSVTLCGAEQRFIPAGWGRLENTAEDEFAKALDLCGVVAAHEEDEAGKEAASCWENWNIRTNRSPPETAGDVLKEFGPQRSHLNPVACQGCSCVVAETHQVSSCRLPSCRGSGRSRQVPPAVIRHRGVAANSFPDAPPFLDARVPSRTSVEATELKDMALSSIPLYPAMVSLSETADLNVIFRRLECN